MSLKVLHWFRLDLRLQDNPALSAAVEAGEIIPVFILDDDNPKDHKLGGASRWWLHRSLKALNASLSGKLIVRTGPAQQVLQQLVDETGVELVTWNRGYEPWKTARDAIIKNDLRHKGIEVLSFNGSLLWEPWDVQKPDGTPYRVFTRYYRNGCLGSTPPRLLAKLEANQIQFAQHPLKIQSIESLALAPEKNWDLVKFPNWSPGENGARQQIEDFISQHLKSYKEGRDFPALASTSGLSPHLHFGEISPHQVWHAIQFQEDISGPDLNTEHFKTELAWREFSHHLLFHNPNLPHKNIQSKFDLFPWLENNEALRKWQQGQTGIPMVDAGMRELWQTGYMHNRVRMIVGSFLTKNMGLDWRLGERWFWDTLVDADLANNSASWQWVAGCGADAAPFFRIFNPVTQGQKFDPDGIYVKKWIPELGALPPKWLFNPWEAPANVLEDAKVEIGTTYPHPIVDLKKSRQRALDAFAKLKIAR